MNHNNLVVFCLKCGGHFKVDKTLKVQVISGFEELETVKNLHICNPCYDSLPKTDEILKPGIEKV